MEINERLKKIHINPKSDIGKKLIKLDGMYSRKSAILRDFSKLKNEYDQLLENIELFEFLLMYKSNKDTRNFIGK